MGTPRQAANAATIECVSRSLVGASVLTPAASSKLPQPTSLDFQSGTKSGLCCS